MKSLAWTWRLNVATLTTTLALLAVPLAGVAQDETVPGDQQSSEPAPAVRKLFVSDKLVLNVYSEADQSGSRVASIETGDAVDELERAQGFVRIRLGDGREGWVGANYLTTDAPAAVQLRDLQRQQKSASQTDKKSADEIARLKKESEALQAQVKELKAAAAAAPAAADDGVLEGASAPQQLAAVGPPATSGSAWIWSLVVILAAGIAYAAGYQTLARRLRKKFGGLRIY
jgi:SH3 domain-containing protein